MASRESYYYSNPQPISSTSIPPGAGNIPNAVPPPPPPKPSSHDPSRTNTPLTSTHFQSSQSPVVPTNPNYGAPPPLPPQHPQSPTHVASPVLGTYAHNQVPGQAPASAFQGQQQQQQQQQQQPQQHQPNQVPPINSGWLPEKLASHTTSDLSSLLSQPSLLSSFSLQHPSYKSSLAPLDSAISSSIASAQQVVQLEEQVKALREQTGQLLLQHTSLQTQWRRKQTEMDDALAPWGPRNMYQRLVASISEQEALLFAVFESFMEGGDAGKAEQDYYGGDRGNGGKATEKEVTEWIKRIREGATILEKRREIRARWDETRVGGWR